MVLPEAIDNDASRQRPGAVLDICQPLGQPGPPIAALFFARFDPAGDGAIVRTQGREHTEPDISAFFLRVAALQQGVLGFVAAVPGQPLDLGAGAADGDLAIAGAAGQEEADKAVVVALSDRIVFMVMAPGAADGQGEKGGSRGRHDVVHLVVFRLLPVDAINVGYR